MKITITILAFLLLSTKGYAFLQQSNIEIPSTTVNQTLHPEFVKYLNKQEALNGIIAQGRKAISEAKYLKAMEYFIDVLEMAKIINDTNYIGTIYSYISLTYGLVDNAPEALSNALEAQRYLANSSSIQLRNWATVGLGSSYFISNNYPKADSLLTSVILSTDKYESDNQFMIYAYTNLASIRVHEGDYISALDLLTQATSYSETYHTHALTVSFFKLGELYLKLEDTVKAHECFRKAHDLALAEPDKSYLTQIYRIKAQFFKKQGNLEQSVHYFALVDSLTSNNTYASHNHELQTFALKNQKEKLQKLVEIKQQQTEIERLNFRRKTANLTALISILLFSLSASWSVLLLKKRRRAIKITNLKHEISRANEQSLKNYIRGQEEERNRLARDLHDGIGSQLAVLKMQLNQSLSSKSDNQIAKKSTELCDEIYQSLRDVAYNLMPRTLIKEGLVSALSELTHKLRKSTNIDFRFINYGLQQRLDNEVESAIFRIAQEVAANIVKHSSAKNANIEISIDSNSIGLTLSWDGKGFNPIALERSKGHGWKNIKTRLAQVDGLINVDSSEEHDFTTMLIEIPIEREKKYGKAS